MRTVRCKGYHQARTQDDPGHLAQRGQGKSRCPGWAGELDLQQRLIEEALIDPTRGEDVFGRPKVIWNAVAGTVFIGVSTNEAEPANNCYPNTPDTVLHRELSKRAERTLEQFSSEKGRP